MTDSPENQLLEYLAAPEYVPSRVDDIIKALGLDKREARFLKKSLPRMLGAGAVVNIKGDRLALPSTADLMTGVVLFRAGGSARFLPETAPGAPAPESIHISAEDTGIALHGDKVVIRLNREEQRHAKRDRRQARPGESSRTGRVIRILTRANELVPGTLRKTRLFWYVVPDDPRISRDILVPEPAKCGLPVEPKENDKVVVRMGEWEQRHLNPVGDIVEVLGETHTPMAEYKAILRKYRLNPEFPPEVVSQVEGIPSRVLPEEAEGRRDFRDILTFTIDPDDAKDFDDALSIERLSEGRLRIGIHIADVSYYVRPGTPLDKEARNRGNSTYLVGTVVPMLPHALSSGLCSLVEGEDRLTKALIITFAPDATVLKVEAANSIIRSRKRLTYKQAYGFMTQDALADLRALPTPAKHHSGLPGRPLNSLDDAELVELRDAIRDLWSIASKLREGRFKKGALDLDMSETKIFVDAEGYAERAEIIHNDESHQLIEEYMLLANESVARLLSDAGLTHLSRVHDEPDTDKLSDLRQELLAGGIKVGDLTKREEVVKLLRIIKEMDGGLPLRIRFLRSLKQACYRPSVDGHYGLAKKYYSHFTSPIRRYADLVEHRIFDFHLQRTHAPTAPTYKAVQYSPAELAQVADHVSTTERNSTEAERDSVKVKLMELFDREMNKRDRTVFEAIITEVRNHGFNVELTVSQAYGLVHLSTLTDDFYVLAQDGTSLIGRRTRRVYRAGDKVHVTVDRVDRFKRLLDFRIAPSPAKAAPVGAPRERDSRHGEAPAGGSGRHGHERTGRVSRGGDARRHDGRRENRSDKYGRPFEAEPAREPSRGGHGDSRPKWGATKAAWVDTPTRHPGVSYGKFGAHPAPGARAGEAATGRVERAKSAPKAPAAPAPAEAAPKTGFVGRLVRKLLGKSEPEAAPAPVAAKEVAPKPKASRPAKKSASAESAPAAPKKPAAKRKESAAEAKPASAKPKAVKKAKPAAESGEAESSRPPKAARRARRD